MSKLWAIRLTTMTTVTIKPICMWEQLIMFSKAPKTPVIRPEIQTNRESWGWRVGGKCRSGRQRLKASSLWYSRGVWITVKTKYELESLRKKDAVDVTRLRDIYCRLSTQLFRDQVQKVNTVKFCFFHCIHDFHKKRTLLLPGGSSWVW